MSQTKSQYRRQVRQKEGDGMKKKKVIKAYKKIWKWCNENECKKCPFVKEKGDCYFRENKTIPMCWDTRRK